MITVYYSDTGIVLQTGSATVELPPPDATALATAIQRAVLDHAAHQQLIAEVNAIDTRDNDGHQG